jgi:hypothetical protein
LIASELCVVALPTVTVLPVCRHLSSIFVLFPLVFAQLVLGAYFSNYVSHTLAAKQTAALASAQPG